MVRGVVWWRAVRARCKAVHEGVEETLADFVLKRVTANDPIDESVESETCNMDCVVDFDDRIAGRARVGNKREFR